MITEDYCSCDIARLIKEKALVFAEHTSYIPKYNADGTSELITTITHQTAIKWLREKYDIQFFFLPAQENGKLVYLVEIWTWNEKEGIYESTYAPMPRKKPEQAVEDALLYTLENLI